MNPFEFELRKSLRDVVPRWLKELDEHKGDRSELRRAQNAADVYGVAMAHRLAELLAPEPRHADAVFFVAALLAHVRDPLASTLVERLEYESQGAKPGEGKLKLQRFAQLLRADSLPDRLRLFRRVVQLVDGSVDAVDLAYLFLTWPDNATKRDFARRYFSPRTPHDA
ncbi:MAG TPA: type I-E CRISPR-associated protein Cse2/CasB, partial [Tahibacter sp.]|nr:type I-E CRISPR-associated protein Cse2/CasB [Tahibacter sp.]